MKKTEIPVAKLRKSAVLKIAEDGDTRSVIVFNEEIGRMFLMRDLRQLYIPGLWWDLRGSRAREWRDREDIVAVFKQNREDPVSQDDTLPYRKKKDVICEIILIGDDEPNDVDSRVWKRIL
jgi:hypothetical protein